MGGIFSCNSSFVAVQLGERFTSLTDADLRPCTGLHGRVLPGLCAEKPYYYPGETLNGMLCLNVLEPLDAKCLHVTVYGGETRFNLLQPKETMHGALMLIRACLI